MATVVPLKSMHTLHMNAQAAICNFLCKVQLHASRQSASKHAHEHSEHLLACAGTACTARFKVLVGCTISHALYSAATRNLREKGQNWVKVSPPSVKYGLSSASAKLVTRQVNGLEIRRRDPAAKCLSRHPNQMHLPPERLLQRLAIVHVHATHMPKSANHMPLCAH